MKSNYLYGSVALAMIALLGISMVSAFGFGNGFMNVDLTDEEKAEIEVQREAMRTAVESGDYETWKELHESRLTEENFQKAQERHAEMSEVRELKDELKQAVEDGDDVRVEELKEQLKDLMPERMKNAFKKGFGMGKQRGMQNCGLAE